MMAHEANSPILSIENLHLAYTARQRIIHAIQDASLVVMGGEAVGLAGESGSGKSTLARAAMGLLPNPGAQIIGGKVVVDGKDVTSYSSRQWEGVRGNPIAIVFQDPLSFLNPVLSMGDQIAESVRRHDPNVDERARSIELLDLVKLPPLVMQRYAHELSGGMRQRVMLAIALGCRPKLLIADEPTTALDVTTQGEILGLLRELQSTLDMSLLLISHDLGILRWSCERVYIMYAGHTIESGRTNDVLARPAHPYTRGLVDASRMKRLDDGHFSTIGGDVPQLHQQFQCCPFHDRCSHSMDLCRQQLPSKPSDMGDIAVHQARCWLEESQMAKGG